MAEEYAVRNMLFLDEERQKIEKIGQDSFKIKALFPPDKKEIARKIAMEFNGLQSAAYSIDDRYIIERGAVIDQAVVEGPEWWKNSDNCPDEEFLDKLYARVLEWSQEFQEKLKKNRLTKRDTKAGISS